MQDVLNDSLDTLCLTISLSMTCKREFSTTTKHSRKRLIEVATKLRTTVSFDDMCNTMMLNNMLNIHICPINSI